MLNMKKPLALLSLLPALAFLPASAQTFTDVTAAAGVSAADDGIGWPFDCGGEDRDGAGRLDAINELFPFTGGQA